MMIFCLLLTVGIYFSYYYLLSSQRTESVLYVLLTSFLATCAQIILTELLLGLVHQLYLFYLVILNVALFALVLVIGRWFFAPVDMVFLKNDLLQIRQKAAAAFDGYAVVLGSLAVLTYGWILVATYCLPPRGIDDLVYHLPSIFEYIQLHEIKLLQLNMRSHFSFPENAELLFMWPAIFTHSQQWVDGANVPFVLASVLTIYSIFRQFALPAKEAAFTALLYALCPVVLMQAGGNYVEIIVSLFLLISLYFSLLFYRRRRTQDLYAAGIAIGLMCGMKYTGLFLAIPLQVLILPRIFQIKWRHAIGYMAVIVLAGGWWYIRNTIVLGNPIYPMQSMAGNGILYNIKYNLDYWIVRYPLLDSGVGSYDGGFGLVFWGLCFSSWIYITVRTIVTFSWPQFPKLLVFAYVPIGFLLLLMQTQRNVDFNGRFAMFGVAIGLFALCDILRILHNKRSISLIKVLCLALSVFTVSLMSISSHPSFRISDFITDKINHVEASEFKYLNNAHDLHTALKSVWETLDFITRDDAIGLNCYIASHSPLYSPSPVYGSKLQNHVMNIGEPASGLVDAYVCTYAGKELLGLSIIPPGSSPDVSLQGATTIRDIMEKDEYVAAVLSNHGCLMLRKEIFEDPKKQRFLQNYYRNSWPEAFAVAKKIEPLLDDRIVIITSSEIGYGVRAISRENIRMNRVHMTFAGNEGVVAEKKKVRECYTFIRPLSGYASRKISNVVYRNSEISVYFNWRT